MRAAYKKPVETTPAAMGALARLPVFLDLNDKRAVIAGGTAAASWKAELLAAAGAHVEVFAECPGPEMISLAKRSTSTGTVTLIARQIAEADLAGAAVAICDASDDEEAAAFAASAHKAGVLFNVIDKPEHCQFQLGSIVNRSPVVIAISTAGAAPILGQTIRRRIETLLPASLAAWGTLAKKIRPAVARRLSAGPQRRTFWERFADMSFDRFPDDGGAAVATVIEQIATDTAAVGGRVTIVGAGPGSAELLTLKAVRALQAADIILYDDLVSEEVLDLARREAKRMLVGKRGRRESCRQDDINDLMIKLARQGRHVVRLKSGDPMIFGRAGEEIARLKQEGIAVEVVPGITSAAAFAALLGVSLTHRDTAHSVRFVTGHSRHGELPDDLDWRGLADPDTTLIVYMGGRTAPRFAAKLLANGLSPATPVVAASSISRPGMHTLATTLKGLLSPGALDPLDGPVLIGIGSAFSEATAAGLSRTEPAPSTAAA